MSSHPLRRVDASSKLRKNSKPPQAHSSNKTTPTPVQNSSRNESSRPTKDPIPKKSRPKRLQFPQTLQIQALTTATPSKKPNGPNSGHKSEPEVEHLHHHHHRHSGAAAPLRPGQDKGPKGPSITSNELHAMKDILQDVETHHNQHHHSDEKRTSGGHEHPHHHHDHDQKRHSGSEKRHSGSEKRHSGSEKRHSGSEKRHSGSDKRHSGASHHEQHSSHHLHPPEEDKRHSGSSHHEHPEGEHHHSGSSHHLQPPHPEEDKRHSRSSHHEHHDHDHQEEHHHSGSSHHLQPPHPEEDKRHSGSSHHEHHEHEHHDHGHDPTITKLYSPSPSKTGLAPSSHTAAPSTALKPDPRTSRKSVEGKSRHRKSIDVTQDGEPHHHHKHHDEDKAPNFLIERYIADSKDQRKAGPSKGPSVTSKATAKGHPGHAGGHGGHSSHGRPADSSIRGGVSSSLAGTSMEKQAIETITTGRQTLPSDIFNRNRHPSSSPGKGHGQSKPRIQPDLNCNTVKELDAAGNIITRLRPRLPSFVFDTPPPSQHLPDQDKDEDKPKDGKRRHHHHHKHPGQQNFQTFLMLGESKKDSEPKKNSDAKKKSGDKPSSGSSSSGKKSGSKSSSSGSKKDSKSSKTTNSTSSGSGSGAATSSSGKKPKSVLPPQVAETETSTESPPESSTVNPYETMPTLENTTSIVSSYKGRPPYNYPYPEGTGSKKYGGSKTGGSRTEGTGTQPTEGDEVSEPMLSMTDKGAIRLQLPGRIQHKTTIKLTHFPEGSSDSVVINVPSDGGTLDNCGGQGQGTPPGVEVPPPACDLNMAAALFAQQQQSQQQYPAQPYPYGQQYPGAQGAYPQQPGYPPMQPGYQPQPAYQQIPPGYPPQQIQQYPTIGGGYFAQSGMECYQNPYASFAPYGYPPC